MVRVRAVTAALALATVVACTPERGREPAPEQASAFSALASQLASEQAAIENPPALPALDPSRPRLTEDEARALVLNLVPPVTGSAAGEWRGIADAPLEDAQVRACDRSAPLPLTESPDGPDALKDGSPDLLDFYSRGLLRSGDGVPESGSLTTFVFLDAQRAATAIRNVDALAGSTCSGTRVTARLDLAPVPPGATRGSTALLLDLLDDRTVSAQTVVAVRLGPVVVLAEGVAADEPAATANALRMWEFAAARLRGTGLLR